MDAMHELLPRASTGVAGLDRVLEGGLARNRLHLLEGSPGTGKTTARVHERTAELAAANYNSTELNEAHRKARLAG